MGKARILQRISLTVLQNQRSAAPINPFSLRFAGQAQKQINQSTIQLFTQSTIL